VGRRFSRIRRKDKNSHQKAPKDTKKKERKSHAKDASSRSLVIADCLSGFPFGTFWCLLVANRIGFKSVDICGPFWGLPLTPENLSAQLGSSDYLQV
jgi:hypothetical protein